LAGFSGIVEVPFLTHLGGLVAMPNRASDTTQIEAPHGVGQVPFFRARPIAARCPNRTVR
jgi:hypothetical protein